MNKSFRWLLLLFLLCIGVNGAYILYQRQRHAPEPKPARLEFHLIDGIVVGQGSTMVGWGERTNCVVSVLYGDTSTNYYFTNATGIQARMFSTESQ